MGGRKSKPKPKIKVIASKSDPRPATAIPQASKQPDPPSPPLGFRLERSEIVLGGGVVGLVGIGLAFLSMATEPWQYTLARFWFVASAIYLVCLWHRWVYSKTPPWTVGRILATGVISCAVIAIGVGGVLFVNHKEQEQRARTSQRDPDAFYQNGRLVATVTGATPNWSRGTVSFGEIKPNRDLNPDAALEYRKWMLNCTSVSGPLRTTRPDDAFMGTLIVPQRYGWECTIVGTREGSE